MWSTNLHEPLISGQRSFVVIPDGRRYAIDLVKGTAAEGADGDLVAWIKRPEKVRSGQRYDSSCELSVPGGGLLASENQIMFVAPKSGYTNAFSYHEEPESHWWSGAFERKLFYIELQARTNARAHQR